MDTIRAAINGRPRKKAETPIDDRARNGGGHESDSSWRVAVRAAGRHQEAGPEAHQHHRPHCERFLDAETIELKLENEELRDDEIGDARNHGCPGHR